MNYITHQTASLEYRRAATQQASVTGLVIALHDTLIGDLRRAAEAMEKNDIQARCDQLIHGFRVLQQLEAMLDMENGGETAINARRFYTHVRGQMLAAQFNLSAKTLHDQIRIVFEVRQAWQQLDSSPIDLRCKNTPGFAPTLGSTERAGPAETRPPFSCSG